MTQALNTSTQNEHSPPLDIRTGKHLAVDAGNRAVKWAEDSKPIRCIPSIYKDLEEWDDPQPDQYSVVIEYLDGHSDLKSQRWAVGAIASDLGGQHTFLTEKAYLAQKLVLAAIEPIPGQRQVVIERLITCLPNDLQGDKVQAVKDGLMGVHQFKRNGTVIIAQIRAVEVQPETLGAYRWAKGKGLFKYARPNGILDLGGKTGIGQLFTPNGSLIRESRVILPGTYALAQLAAKHPELMRGDTTADLALIMDGIANSSFSYGTTGISFSDRFPTYLNHWLTDLKNRLKIGWAKWLDDLGEVVIIGGSAHLAKQLEVSTQGRFKVCEAPQTANVKGMLLP